MKRSAAGWMLVIVALLLYLPSLLVYVIHPGQWWIMGILSIGFPLTWLGMAPMVVIGWRLHRMAGALLLCLWLAGWPVMRYTFALQVPQPWQARKNPDDLRVMQWNCMELGGSYHTDTTRKLRRQIVEMLRQYQPDVLLLQDFQEVDIPGAYSNISLLRDSLGYAYYHYEPFYRLHYASGTISEGTAIFSRLPFDTAGSRTYSGRPHAEHIVWADLPWKGSWFRLLSTHFYSMNLNTPPGLPDPLPYYQQYDSAIVTSGNVWKKLRFYQPYHVQQATELKAFLDSSSRPVVMGIDMNSVPSSFVYHRVSRGLQDAFLQTGFGWGRTYRSRLPQLRIDYLFAAPGLQIRQATTVPTLSSDHYPVVADLYHR
ncbi:MAG: endonuclease/exonuclease/phosphatase family protein [Chitinophagaceae bacterium]|nr:endonuclease/exonuclease/phosphatase family protein [Chitinophagaceae bacterium]